MDATQQDTNVAPVGIIASLPTPAHPTSTSAQKQNSGDQGKTCEGLHVAMTLAQDGHADEAAAVLTNECGDAPAAQMCEAYAAVLDARLRNQDLEGAFNLLAEARSRGCTLNGNSYEAVLRANVHSQQHARSVELLRDMCGVDATPNDATFNHVLDGAVRSRSFGEAWDILEILLTHQRKADKYFVSILTKSLEATADRRCVRRGIGLVDRFIEQQREDVDEIVFNSLLNVLGHVGDMLKLQQTLDKMHCYGVPPSAVTYGTVVKAYGRARDIDAVIKVWNDMRQRRLGVNPVTCGCVLDACVKCGHLDKAMAIFQEMRLQGLHKNTVLYATLIKGLAKARDLVGAVHLYQEMRTEHVPCNLVTFNSLMDVCVRVGDLQMAAVFLQDMMQLAIEPDLITFSTLIKGYSHIGEVNKALALADELKSRGLKCDEIMYNSLIDGCSKAHELDKGLSVFHDMLNSNVPPSNITFSILVKLYFEDGRANEAFRLVDEMQTLYRCPPSRVVYSVLLRCCAQFGGASLPRGAALLNDLASKRHSKLPDQGMVGTILQGCVQHQDLDTAIQLTRDFGPGKNRHGTAPLDSMRSLFEALTARGDTARGNELLEFLRKRGLPNAHVTQLRGALNGQTVLNNNVEGQHLENQDVQYNQYHGSWYGQQDAYQHQHHDWYPQQQHQEYHHSPTHQDFYNAALYMSAAHGAGYPQSPASIPSLLHSGGLNVPGNLPTSLPSSYPGSYAGSYAGSLPGSLPGSFPGSPAIQGVFPPPPPPYPNVHGLTAGLPMPPPAGLGPLHQTPPVTPHMNPAAAQLPGPAQVAERPLPQSQPATVPPRAQVTANKENTVPPSTNKNIPASKDAVKPEQIQNKPQVVPPLNPRPQVI
jgi:pentatricopeptide repeat protein